MTRHDTSHSSLKSSTTNTLSQKRILKFWLPMASTWWLMALEGPFLNAFIARMDDPKYNLAAFGVAFAVALLIEAPVIMMLSAATSLIKDGSSYRKMRNFSWTINITTLAFSLLIVVPWIFQGIASILNLDKTLTELTYQALVYLIPWGFVIGIRRFYQGVLISQGLTQYILFGTMCRLIAVVGSCIYFFQLGNLDGAALGSACLSIGVCTECLFTFLIARAACGRTKKIAAESSPLSYKQIIQYYIPLAATSLLGLGIHPVITLFVGYCQKPLESLAVIPLINGFVFLFRCVGLSFQDVGLALSGKNFANKKALGKFAGILGLSATGLFGFICFSGLSLYWFGTLAGLSSELSMFATPFLNYLIIIPALSVYLAYLRISAFQFFATQYITKAMFVEIGTIILVMLCAILFKFSGVQGQVLALATGRLMGCFYMQSKQKYILSLNLEIGK